nr:MAG: ORF2 [Torque teno polar bear virus 35]
MDGHSAFLPPVPGTQEFRRQEALWKRSCAASHDLFCRCGAWWTHVPCRGFRAANGSGKGTGTSEVVPGPLDGATIKGRGLTGEDIQEGLDAAVSFQLDDAE